MTTRTNIFSAIAMVFTGIILVLFLLGNKIQCNKPVETSKVTTSDTTRGNIIVNLQVPPSVPQITTSQKPIIIPQQYQPSSDYAALVKQYNELANKFLSINTYRDSIELKDSSGSKVGVVKLEDKVSENQIKLRSPSYQLKFPTTTITNTTTITQTNPPVNKLFVLGEVTGSSTVPFINGANVGLMFMNKKDNGLYLKGGGMMINGTIQPQFQIGKAWKISLRR